MSDFAGFSQSRIKCGAVHLNVRRGGQGTPLILIHGYPQNHRCWAKVASNFAAHFDVIIPDLRGYGQSDAPADDAGHTVYSKRQMALDVVALMDALNLSSVMVLGHDRGARVSYRLALDHPDRVTRLGIIEIVPTGDFWGMWNAQIAMNAYHWTFLAQPAPMPETMIAADPAGYMDWTLANWSGPKNLSAFPAEALQSYRDQAADPSRMTAMCADYRAGATTDRQIDDADRAAGRKLSMPMHFLYGEHGFPASTGDPIGIWRDWCDDVTASTCETGHFVMDEDPQAVIDAFIPFFQGAP